MFVFVLRLNQLDSRQQGPTLSPLTVIDPCCWNLSHTYMNPESGGLPAPRTEGTYSQSRVLLHLHTICMK